VICDVHANQMKQEKIFEVANALLDVTTVSHGVLSESDELQYLYGFLSTSRSAKRVYIPILDAKLTDLHYGSGGIP
jgi:hypothetical protein